MFGGAGQQRICRGFNDYLMINCRRPWLRLESGADSGRGRPQGPLVPSGPKAALLVLPSGGGRRALCASQLPPDSRRASGGTLLGTLCHCPYFLNSQSNFVGDGAKHLHCVHSSGGRVFALLHFSMLTERWQERITERGPCFFQRTKLSVEWKSSLIVAMSTVLISSH